jgi:5-methylthioadenosine/S-adenosylhomocysteine deaminase
LIRQWRGGGSGDIIAPALREDRRMTEAKRSRRTVLKSGLLAAAGAAITPAANAQAGDPDLQRLGSARRILFRNAIVLTLDRAVGDFGDADLLVEDGKISEVRPRIAADDAVVLDASDRILIPGFIDTHVHSYQGALHDMHPNGELNPDYNRDIQNNLTLLYRPEDVHAGVLATALALLSLGTTTMVDISQISHTPAHSDADIAALKEAGIRAVFAYYRGAGPKAQYPQDIYRLRRTYFNGDDQLLTLALGADRDAKTFMAARAAGVRAVMHIRFAPEVILALSRAGVLRAGDEFIHCTGLNDAAWNVIKDTGIRTSHSPPLEMAMGHGTPAIQDALDHGLRPSLSSDHSAVVAQDMFGIMRAAFEVQRMMLHARARAGEKNLPPFLAARDVLEFATIEGARCAALDSRIGTLTPGKDADIVVLRADGFDVWPRNNAFGAAASLMNAGHVESVFVAGKPRKWRGQLVGVDAARVRARIAQSRDYLFRRGNIHVDLVGS